MERLPAVDRSAPCTHVTHRDAVPRLCFLGAPKVGGRPPEQVRFTRGHPVTPKLTDKLLPQILRGRWELEASGREIAPPRSIWVLAPGSSHDRKRTLRVSPAA